MDSVEFLRRPLRAPHHERVIRGFFLRTGAPRVEIALFREGSRCGTLQIDHDGAAVVRKAIERVGSGALSDDLIGTFQDGRFSIEVSADKARFGPAIFLQKYDADWAPAGSPLALYSEDHGGLAEALDWLQHAQ